MDEGAGRVGVLFEAIRPTVGSLGVFLYGCFGCVLVAAFPPKMITKATDFS